MKSIEHTVLPQCTRVFVVNPQWLWILFQTRWQNVSKSGIKLLNLSNKQAKMVFWKPSAHTIFSKVRTGAEGPKH